MNTLKISSKFIVLLVSSLFLITFTFAQNSKDNGFLTNENVLELANAGMSEVVILAKIKNSQCSFDKSSAALIKLKESGVSDLVITAMIEANSNGSSDIARIYEIKDAIGKRKVFVACQDGKSRDAIVKTLAKNGFDFVEKQNDSELVVDFDFEIHTTSLKTPASLIIGDMGNQDTKQKWGRFHVSLFVNGKKKVIFKAERQPESGVIVKFIHKQAEDYTKDFIKEFRRFETNK